MSAMQDPKIQQLVGMNPMAQQIQAAMMSHINEHIAFEYRKQMEHRMGIDLPAPGEETENGIPEGMEVRISQLAAQAAQQMLQQNQQEAQAQQNAQSQQDPLVQMQQEELQIKREDLELKKQKMILDQAAKVDQLKIEESRIEAQKEIAGMQVGAKAAKDKAELDAKMELEGVKVGSDIAYKKAQLNESKGSQKKGE
jgi:hypothetical protein